MKTDSSFIRRAPSRIAILLLLCAAAGANAATTTQTTNFSFLPYAKRTLSFNKFDTNGGEHTLTAVHITIQYTRTGGRYEYDNESEDSATITLINRLTLMVDTKEVLDLTKMGSSSRLGGYTGLKIESSKSATFGADDDPEDDTFSYTGPDYFRYDLPEMTVSDAAYMNNIGQFVGTDAFNLEVEGTQNDVSTLLSGMRTLTSPSSVSGSMTIVYEYEPGTPIPEPRLWSMACMAAVGVLLIRRRPY
jgi:hypothetical protein